LYTLCDKVCQWFATGQWFSVGPPVSSIDITEMLLKVVLNTVKQTYYSQRVVNVDLLIVDLPPALQRLIQ
jgi:hypothetical protein